MGIERRLLVNLGETGRDSPCERTSLSTLLLLQPVHLLRGSASQRD